MCAIYNSELWYLLFLSLTIKQDMDYHVLTLSAKPKTYKKKKLLNNICGWREAVC